LPRFVD